jgi:hypothetical protein
MVNFLPERHRPFGEVSERGNRRTKIPTVSDDNSDEWCRPPLCVLQGPAEGHGEDEDVESEKKCIHEC